MLLSDYMKAKLFLGASAFLILGAGCTSLFSIPEATGITSADISTAQSVSLHSEHFEDKKDVIGTGGCSVSIDYPVIDETNGLTDFVRKSVQSEIDHQIMSALDSGERTVVSDAGEVFLDNCTQGLTESISGGGDDWTSAQMWTSEISYSILKNSAGVLSLSMKNASYLGGAHPGEAEQYLMFDLSNGDALSLKDIIAEGHYADIAKALAQKLVAEDADAMYPEELALYQTFLTSPSEDAAVSLLQKHGQYAESDDGLNIAFDTYEIAPYAAGPIEINILSSEIEGALTR